MGLENQRYYTASELAKEHRVTRQAVWNWIRQGRLNAVRLGTAYRISQFDWAAFTQERD